MEEGHVWFYDADNMVGPFAALYGQFGEDGPLALKVVNGAPNYPGPDLRMGRVSVIHFLLVPIGDPHTWSSWQYELGEVFDTFNNLS